MKRATRTPNPFITSTRSWPVKGLTLFLILLALGSCEDDLGRIGTRRQASRFGVYFKEFDIPVTTVQTDSLRSDIGMGERLLVGVATDPNFGKATANLYSQFAPLGYTSPKIDKTGKSNFVVESLTINFVLSSSYYVYGDTANSTENFNLHWIDQNTGFELGKKYYTVSSVAYDPTPLASTSFTYLHDTIVDHRKKNSDTNANNNRYDTIAFSIPVGPGTLGQQLLDTALAKGVYHSVEAKKAFKTDSVFRLAFPGFALVPASTNTKIFGIKTKAASFNNSTFLVLKYSYVKDGSTLKSKYYYGCEFGPGFSSVGVDRASTILSDIDPLNESDKHVDFNLPDDYCYLQSGTGLYAKLDFSGVHAYFDANPDTILNMAINAAELTVDLESVAARQHLSMPGDLLFRVVSTSNEFLEVPSTEIVEYAINYNCVLNGTFLDARKDTGGQNDILTIALTKSTATANAYYSAYVSDFTQYLLSVPADFQKVYYMGLIPAVPEATYGKSLHGLSFKKDKVKLRVFYTKTL